MIPTRKYIDNYNELVKYTNAIYSVCSIEKLREFILESDAPICICGSGNSYVVAQSIAKIINQLTGIITFSKRTRDLLYYNCAELKRMIFISFSNSRIEYEQVRALAEKSIILSFFSDNEIQFDNIAIVSKTRGQWTNKVFFNSPQATLVPIEFVYFSLTSKVLNTYTFWRKKMEDKIYIGKMPLRIAVLAGDFCEMAAYDLKNKFVESRFGIVDIYEKRDFAHGKFLSFGECDYDLVLYLKQNSESEYEDLLLEYLRARVKVDVIKSQYCGIEAEIDLLQAEQTYVYLLCMANEIDFGDNNIDDSSKKLFYCNRNIY